MTESYHFQIEPEPRADVQGLYARIAEYRARAVESMNKLVELQFPSGAALQVSGDKVVGRSFRFSTDSGEGATCNVSPLPEPQRAPLPHFNQRTEFDPFPGFKVRSDTGWMTGEDGHPLQRMTADSPTHGSAHLLAKP